MQPESTADTAKFIISADGKCENSPASLDGAEEIELIINGTLLTGGAISPTLLGSSSAFLAESRHYTLSHFEPMKDGRCLAKYVRTR